MLNFLCGHRIASGARRRLEHGAAAAAVAAALLSSGCGSDSSITLSVPTARVATSTPTIAAATATRTAAETPIGTAPPTHTSSPAATATETSAQPPTRTATATVRPTGATATAAATSTPPPRTATTTAPPDLPTATTTATVTQTAAATASHTATGLPTGTATATASVTATATRTDTPGPTATFTATSLPTVSLTATATPTGGGAVCGNRVLEPSETCESCAADCVVGPCNAPGMPTQAFIVDLVQPTGFQPTSATVRLGYNSTTLNLPGSGTATTVRQRVVAPAPVPQAFTPNDLDYAVQVLVSRNIPLTQLFTATFDRCSGAAAATLADLSCTVLSCAQGGGGVAGCTCTVRLP